MRSKAICLALLAFAFAARAVPVSERQARLAASAWARGGERFGLRIGTRVDVVRQYAVKADMRFFAVRMSPSGTIFLSGETDDDPVLAMTSADLLELEEASPLYALLARDLEARQNARASGGQTQEASREALLRWLRLARAGERMADASGAVAPSDQLPTDLRVNALVKSKWSQSGNGENLYTPNNYVCGCVATAMAQLMRYYAFPVAAVAQFTNPACEVDGVPTPQTAMGGVYDWANMPYLLNTMTEEKRAAVGRLTYDCGVAVGMSWAAGGSGAYSRDIAPALKGCFGYANAEHLADSGLSTDESLREQVVYASLDAGCPVIFGINRKGEDGHEVIGDGYGYIDSLSYIHLNMGWAGQGDVWYHFPDIVYTATAGGTAYRADTVADCTYNVFPRQTGWIVSGRTLDDEGVVRPGAAVRILNAATGAEIASLTSSETGVYGAVVPAGVSCRIEATAEDYAGESETPAAEDNQWGVDIVLQAPSVRVIAAGTVVTNSTLNKALSVAATLAEPTIEIFAPTRLRQNVTITNSCTIVSSPDLDGPAEVARENLSTLTVAAATALSLSNVVFSSASSAPVVVEAGGMAAFAGVTSVSEMLSVETVDAEGFVLAGPIFGGVSVLVADALAEGDVFGWADCALDTAQAMAAKVVHPTDARLGGEAFLDGDSGKVRLRWAVVDVDHDAATASARDATGAWLHYRTFEAALADGATEIVLKKSGSFNHSVSFSGAVTIRSENGAVLTPGPAAGFVAGAGADVTFKDLTVRGFRGADSLVVVDGGQVTFGSGLTLEDLETCRPEGTCCGPVLVRAGTLTVESGALLTGLRAVSPGNSNESGVYGGAICVYPGGTLDLRGGTIANCYSEVTGGAVYAFNGATVRLSGDVTVWGNACLGRDGTLVEDDVKLSPKAELYLDGALTGGSVGVAYTSQLNDDGVGFVKAGEGAAADVLAASAVHFVNTANSGTCRARDDGSGALVWETVPPVVGPVPVEPLVGDSGFITNATARVRYPDGTCNYWVSVSEAVASLTGPATVELLYDDVFIEDIVPAHSFTLTTAADYAGYPYFPVALFARADQAEIVLTNGVSMTVESLDVVGSFTPDGIEVYGGNTRLFDVRGGALVLDNTYVYDVYGETDRAAAAVTAYAAGSVELKGGSVITYCSNSFDDPDENAGAAGGIVVEDAGTVLTLRDSAVTMCYSRKTGGVFVGNRATIRLGGATRIAANGCFDENSKGNLVLAKGANLILEDELTDRVGLSEGVGGDSLVFGKVLDGASAAVRASATNFCHDVTHVFGRTEGDDLVWQDLSTRTVVAAPAAADGPFVCSTGEQVGLAPAPGFVVYGGAATHAGEYDAVAELDDGCVWDDGTSGVRHYPWTIAPAPLEVTVRSAGKKAGEEDPDFDYDDPVGLLSDVDFFVGSLTRAPGEEPGTYEIFFDWYAVYRQSTEDPTFFEDVTGDYEPVFVPGVFTIRPEGGGDDPPDPPPPPPGPVVVTNTPDPIAFKSIERVSDFAWKLVVTNLKEKCEYSLAYTDNLSSGLVTTGAWMRATSSGAWTTNVILSSEAPKPAFFWQALGRETYDSTEPSDN